MKVQVHISTVDNFGELVRGVRQVELQRGRMAESTRQVEGLFESLLAEAFSS